MPRISGDPIGSGIQSAALSLQILEFIVIQRKPIGVTPLALAMSMPKSRIHRHLQTLLEQGYIYQPEGLDLYYIGPRLVRLGLMVSESVDLSSIARPFMEELRNQLGHTVVIAEADPDGVRILTSIRGRAAIEVNVRAGSVLEYNSTAQGKILAAFSDDATYERAVHNKCVKHTPHTIVTAAALRREFDTVRKQGWAHAPNEAIIGLNAMAAPIFGARGVLCGTLAIIDAIQFIGEAPSIDHIDAVKDCAAKISTALGYAPAGDPVPAPPARAPRRSRSTPSA